MPTLAWYEFYKEYLELRALAFSVWRSSINLLVFSNSWVRAFFSSRACILSCKWTWRRSLDSARSLSTVAESLELWSSLTLRRWLSRTSSVFFSSNCASSLAILSSADPCLSWAWVKACNLCLSSSSMSGIFENWASFCSASSSFSWWARVFSSWSFSWASLCCSSCSNFSFRSWSEVDSRWAFRYRFSSVAIRSSCRQIKIFCLISSPPNSHSLTASSSHWTLLGLKYLIYFLGGIFSQISL